MRPTYSESIRPIRIKPLATCLALSLGIGTTDGLASTGGTKPSRQPTRPTTIIVTNCNDAGQGSLRQAVMDAAPGATVDMSALTCSTITLTSGAIGAHNDDLTILGPGDNALMIDAAYQSEIFDFYFVDSGTIRISDLSVERGSYYTHSVGCIFAGNLSLTNVAVSRCQGAAVVAIGDLALVSSTISDSVNGYFATAGAYATGNVSLVDSVVSGNAGTRTTGDPPRGGAGVFTSGDLHIERSQVIDNTATATSGTDVCGGGITANDGASLIDSVISGNAALSTADPGAASGGGACLSGSNVDVENSSISHNEADGDGGGLVSSGNLTLNYTTLDHNQARNNAALIIGGTGHILARLWNSTISGNTASASSAIFASIPIEIDNSTIAFNTAVGTSAGLYLYPGGDVTLRSTIISNNTSTSGGGFDFVSRAGVFGDHDLIQNPGSTVPSGTITGVDPLLQLLADNGGPTLTHAIGPESAAIDAGANARGLVSDQRGIPYARVYGNAADIGAYELQPDSNDTIFANGFD